MDRCTVRIESPVHFREMVNWPLVEARIYKGTRPLLQFRNEVPEGWDKAYLSSDYVNTPNRRFSKMFKVNEHC